MTVPPPPALWGGGVITDKSNMPVKKVNISHSASLNGTF